MYCGDGVIISHYKSDTKKLMFDMNMNDVKMDWECIMEEEEDTILYSLNSSWRTSNRTHHKFFSNKNKTSR